MRSANNVGNAGSHVRQTFLNDVFTFLTEAGNAGRVVNTGTSSVNSEFVTALIYVIFYLFLVNIIGNCHENKYEPALPTLFADLMFFCPLGPIGPTNFKNCIVAVSFIG
jgi:hypothetical protein